MEPSRSLTTYHREMSAFARFCYPPNKTNNRAIQRYSSAILAAVIRFLFRRVLLAVPTMVGVTMLVFGMIKILPGNEVDVLLGATATPAQRLALEDRLGLTHPIPLQYLDWLSHALRGNLGDSFALQMPVSQVVFAAFKNTLILAGFAMALALVLGVLIGLVGTRNRHSLAARLSDSVSLFAVSAPQYSLALVFVIYPAATWKWFPVQGIHGLHARGFGDLAYHAALPALTAALVPGGILGRMFRSSLLDVLGQEFLVNLEARGLSARRCLVHAIHNTLPSVLTVLGLLVGYLLGGVLFVEVIFSWPGMGEIIYNAISQRDFSVIQAGVLLSALLFIVVNIVVDAGRAFIDPRVRAE